MSEQQTLIRDAHVSVIKQFDDKHRPLAAVTVEGEYTHIFPHTSRVSKHLDVMEADDLASRLSGGSFFFIEDQLIDFRDGSYNGFIHEDKTISVFMEILGYQQKTDLQLAHMQKNKRDDIQSPIVLRKVWDKNEISVPGYSGGADFDSVLSFTWNPYVKTINTVFDLVRLICTNGMVGLTSFLNTKVPVMNRWEEHLDIAARQIQNKVDSIIVERVQQMTIEHASVADCLLLEDHTMARLAHAIDSVEHQTLLNIMNAVSPRAQLANVYRESVFNDKNLAAQLPAHLSGFDVFNIATQLRTHTQETAKSTDFAMDKFANGILFDKQDNYNASTGRLTAPSMKSFNDPEQAFFGIAA
jgi:hypothetical protein